MNPRYQQPLARLLAVLGAIGFVVAGALPAPAADGSPAGDELVRRAREEGKVVVYTANQLESEQILAERFEKAFPGISVEIVRAPGSRLLTRIETEAAAGKLGADVVELSDRGLAKRIEGLYADYAPPNAASYPEEHAVSPKLWPKTTWGYVLAYNPALVEEPPASWLDLTDPRFKGRVGVLPAGSGGTPWSLALFQRQVLGLDYWKTVAAQNPVLFPSDSPLASALVRGEVAVAPLKANTIIPLMRQGAPIRIVYPKEGAVLTPSAAGISKSAPHPNAARLYLDWALSPEGQAAWVEGSGGFSLLPGAALPEGANASTLETWVPKLDDYASLRSAWVKEWNEIYNYRQ